MRRVLTTVYDTRNVLLLDLSIIYCTTEVQRFGNRLCFHPQVTRIGKCTDCGGLLSHLLCIAVYRDSEWMCVRLKQVNVDSSDFQSNRKAQNVVVCITLDTGISERLTGTVLVLS
jgi:hypothetical protein